MMKNSGDSWDSGDAYEYFMGRWSMRMAPVFLEWLRFPGNTSWLDVGCGTGALSEAIYRYANPAHVWSIDPSVEFLEKASARLVQKNNLRMGSASEIPVADGAFDIVVSGLALNFFPDVKAAFAEMTRVLKSSGTIAAYVWDYAGRMDFLRTFWDEAGLLDPHAKMLDEGIRFPICNPDNLGKAFRDAGLHQVETCFLEITTTFVNFDDYWKPFLGGQGPAPGYLASLTGDLQEALKENIQKQLPFNEDGSITMIARAIAARGIKNN